jgi:hypothetical protein
MKSKRRAAERTKSKRQKQKTSGGKKASVVVRQRKRTIDCTGAGDAKPIARSAAARGATDSSPGACSEDLSSLVSAARDTWYGK